MGMGRPKKGCETRERYSVMIEPSAIAEIDRLAERVGLSRSQLMRNLVLYGLGDLLGVERFGFLRLAVEFRRMKERLSESDGNSVRA